MFQVTFHDVLTPNKLQNASTTTPRYSKMLRTVRDAQERGRMYIQKLSSFGQNVSLKKMLILYEGSSRECPLKGLSDCLSVYPFGCKKIVELIFGSEFDENHTKGAPHHSKTKIRGNIFFWCHLNSFTPGIFSRHLCSQPSTVINFLPYRHKDM